MINIEKQDKIDVVTFNVNKLNALVTEEFMGSVSKVFDASNSRVVINLSGLKYIDSTGFGCFLAIMKMARNSYGILKFAQPEPAIMELFRTLHLHTVFHIYDDMESCVKSFR